MKCLPFDKLFTVDQTVSFPPKDGFPRDHRQVPKSLPVTDDVTMATLANFSIPLSSNHRRREGKEGGERHAYHRSLVCYAAYEEM